MSRHAGERKRVKVLGVNKRTVTFVSPTSGKKSCIERYRVSSIVFRVPADATMFLKQHDPKIRFPK